MQEKLIKLQDIVSDYKNKSNGDLIYAMDLLSNEFESTKKFLIEQTERLDILETHYNNILEEYKTRTNAK